MADVELLPCAECGMPCRAGEYHPFAACLMFKACRNSETVRANLAALQAENEALRAEVAEWKRVAAAQAELHGEAEARAERLAEALRDAEKSLRTIADRAGGTEYLMTIGDVRGYANSRANEARDALEQENRNG